MKWLTGVAAALAVATLLAGCADEREKTEDEYLELWQELNDTLDKVTDESSLRAALPELRKLNERLKAHAERRKAMDAPTEERRRQLLARQSKDLTREAGRFGKNQRRIAGIKGKEELLEAIQDFGAEP